MDTTLGLLIPIVTMLGIFTIVGFAAVLLLNITRDGLANFALSPAFGLAITSVLLVDIAYITAMRRAAWIVLVPILCISVAVIVLKRKKIVSGFAKRDRLVAGLLLVSLLAVFALYAYPLINAGSVGPMGYQVHDAVGYVAEVDGYKYQAITDKSWGAGPWDIQSQYAAGNAFGLQQIGFDAPSAAINSLFGWNSIDTQTAFMICLVLVGMLAIFGAMRVLFPQIRGYAVLAAFCFSGSAIYQLYMDGSQAALSALAVVPIVFMALALLMSGRQKRLMPFWGALVIAIAGINTLYPLMVPATVGVLALSGLLYIAKNFFLQGRGQWFRSSGSTVLQFGLIVGAALILSITASDRNITYWHTVATSSYLEDLVRYGGLPHYNLPITIVPSWLLQTQEFYHIQSGAGYFNEWLSYDVVPLLAIALIIYGLVKNRSLRWPALFIFVAGSLAWQAVHKYDCTYCEQRNLLILIPLLPILLFAGITRLHSTWSSSIVRQAWLYLFVFMFMALIVHESFTSSRRVVADSYILTKDARNVAKKLEGKSEPVALEATGQAYHAPMEMPAIYYLVRQSSSQRIVSSTETNDYAGISYLNKVPRIAQSEYSPDYRWVVTRARGIKTARKVIYSSGPMALEERTAPDDVLVTSGIAIDRSDRDPEGKAWVQGAMSLWVTTKPKEKAWLLMKFTTKRKLRSRLIRPKGSSVTQQADRSYLVCAPVKAETKPLRRSVVDLKLKVPAPRNIGNKLFVRPIPNKSIRLDSMYVTRKSCMRQGV